MTDRIPKFKSYAEEAEFWDTHDFTEYTDSFHPVKTRFNPKAQDTLTIRFDPQDLSRVRQQAQGKGLATGTLIRMWVKERLKQQPVGRAA